MTLTFPRCTDWTAERPTLTTWSSLRVCVMGPWHFPRSPVGGTTCHRPLRTGQRPKTQEKVLILIVAITSPLTFSGVGNTVHQPHTNQFIFKVELEYLEIWHSKLKIASVYFSMQKKTDHIWQRKEENPLIWEAETREFGLFDWKMTEKSSKLSIVWLFH